MADFREMYFNLFNKVTCAVNILQDAQREAEETYIESDNPHITQLFNDERNEDDYS